MLTLALSSEHLGPNYEENRLIDLLTMCFTVFIQRSINNSPKKKKRKIDECTFSIWSPMQKCPGDEQYELIWCETHSSLTAPSCPSPSPSVRPPQTCSPSQLQSCTADKAAHYIWTNLLSVWRRSLDFFNAAVCQNAHRPPANVVLPFPLSLCIGFNYGSCGLEVMCDVSM